MSQTDSKWKSAEILSDWRVHYDTYIGSNPRVAHNALDTSSITGLTPPPRPRTPYFQSVCFHLPPPPSLSPSSSLSVCLPAYLSVSFSVSLCLSRSLGLCLSVCICLSVSVCLSLSLSVSLSLSLSVLRI